MVKLYQIADAIKADTGNLSKVLSGKRKVSFQLSLKLSKICPEFNVEFWRVSSPEEIRSALEKIVTTTNTNPNQIDLGEIDAL